MWDELDVIILEKLGYHATGVTWCVVMVQQSNATLWKACKLWEQVLADSIHVVLSINVVTFREHVHKLHLLIADKHSEHELFRSK